MKVQKLGGSIYTYILIHFSLILLMLLCLCYLLYIKWMANAKSLDIGETLEPNKIEISL